MNLDNWSLRTKLWVASWGLALMLMAVLIGVGLAVYRAEQSARQAVEQADARVLLVTRWRTMTEATSIMVLSNTVSTEAPVQAQLGAAIKQNIAVITGMQKSVTEMMTSDADKALMAEVAAARAAVLKTTARMGELKKEGRLDAALALVDSDFNAQLAHYTNRQQAVVDAQVALRARTASASEARRLQLLGWGFAAVLASMVAGALLVTRIVRSITKPLAQVVEMAEEVARGDLSHHVEVTRRDELGELMRAFGRMNDRLHGLVQSVRGGVQSVLTASGEIAQGNLDLSTRTEQTSSNLQSTAARMEELTEALGQAAETAHAADELAREAAKAAGRGGDVVQQAVASMGQISDSSKRIADITGVIDGIAFQTNILALNAAVEAARAGEQGRGFAVVASEVRALAQRSAQAAREIKELITASVVTVDEGSRQVRLTGETMTEIVAGVQRVTALMADINGSALRQREGVGDVNSAIRSLDEMTQQNAALVEQSAAAASSLSDQAKRLNEAASVFNLAPHA